MIGLISTILAILRGSGGANALAVGPPEVFYFVGTQVRDCQYAVAQVVRDIGFPGQGKSRGMRHSLYSYNSLIQRGVGGEAPSPQSACAGRGAGPHTPSPTYQFFQNHFPSQYPQEFFVKSF
jgi:hypothetical protein